MSPKDSDFVRPDRYREIDSADKYDAGIRKPSLPRRLSHAMETWALKRALSRVSDGGLVLDSPSGTGRIHGDLQQKFDEVFSLDSSHAMLVVHQNHSHSGRAVTGDIFNLPYADNQFDHVVCYRLFHHMQNDADRVAILKSIARVTNKDIVFTAWVDTPINKRRGSRRRTLSRQELATIINQAGLKMEYITFASWPFQPKTAVVCSKLNA